MSLYTAMHQKIKNKSLIKFNNTYFYFPKIYTTFTAYKRVKAIFI